jgi:DNA-binding transcriptional MerR regulator
MFQKDVVVKLPDKLYFRIGEVSEFTGVKPYVLRYWESEFEEIQPIRRKSQRLYDRETIHLIMRIKHMLYEQNFTIAGAKKMLRDELSAKGGRSKETQILEEILSELKSLRMKLS